MKVSELIRLLKKSGKCYFVRHGGDHDTWYSEITKKKFYIPRHPAQELKTGTANGILKQAGLK